MTPCKVDVLLVAVPILEWDPRPPAGIFLIRAWLQQHGYTVGCIDGNDYGKDSIDNIIDEIDKWDFEWLGLSMLSEWEHTPAISIAMNYNKVIFGGPGVTQYFRSIWKQQLHGGIAHSIEGEGEYAILELLKGNTDYPGIDGIPPVQIEDLSTIPAPDYTGFDYRILTVTGSRGCVRNCSFCNVPSIWKKYRYVDGTVLGQQLELIYKNNKHVQDIQFSDSLVNGSDVEFKKMCNYLIESGNKVPWFGQFIIKNRKREYFEMIIKSGCNSLVMGVESLSESVRWHMGKKFTDEVMYYNIDTLMGLGLPKITLMFVVGYPTETEEDFLKIIPFMKRYSAYRRFMKLSPGLMYVIRDTPIAEEYEHGLRFESDFNVYEDRVVRFIKFIKLIEHFGYVMDEAIPARVAAIRGRVGEDSYNDFCKQAEAEMISDLEKYE